MQLVVAVSVPALQPEVVALQLLPLVALAVDLAHPSALLTVQNSRYIRIGTTTMSQDEVD